MTFEILWPLIFAVAVPIIILLYLLRPKGTRKVVPSNLIWRRLAGANTQASFLQRFFSDPLMYLEILTVIFLILALMSPVISHIGQGSGSVAIVIDTGAGMQHADEKGVSRFERAKRYAQSFIESNRADITLITCDKTARILASGINDDIRMKKILSGISVSDQAAQMQRAIDVIETIDADTVLVLTDEAGKAQLAGKENEYQIAVFGGSQSNLALGYMAADDRAVICMVKNYGPADAVCDVTLFDDKGKVLSSKYAQVPAGASKTLLFDEIAGADGILTGEYIRGQISGIQGLQDSIEKDNENYVFLQETGTLSAALLGNGNRYIEKAYEAVTGKTLTRLENETLLKDEQIVIFDAGVTASDGMAPGDGVADVFGDAAGAIGTAGTEDTNAGAEGTPNATGDGEAADVGDAGMTGTGSGTTTRSILRFASSAGASGTAEKVTLTFTDSEVSAGIEGHTFGVNATYLYDVPAWGTSFLETDGKCAGYYGVDEQGIRRVILGFDIRESNLALLPEFPVLMANSVQFLSDRALLGQHVYNPGDPIKINPSATDIGTLAAAETTKTGLFEVGTKEASEHYAVIFPMDEASDPGSVLEDAGFVTTAMRSVTLKKSLRRICILIALLLVIADLLLFVKRKRYHGKTAYVMAGLTVLLLLLALFDLHLPGRQTGQATIFLADLSDSNAGNLQQMETYLKDCIDKKPANDFYALVTFGEDTQVDQFLTKNDFFAGMQTSPAAHATDMEAAVSTGISMLPEGSAGRLVLLTDARQNRGDIRNMTPAITAGGIELCGLFFETETGNDCYIADAKMPTSLHPGDAYRLDVSVESNYDTPARIEISSGSRVISQKEVQLSKGSNSFVFAMQVSGEESESFQISVHAQGDTCDKNDTYHAYADVRQREKLLVVAGEEGTNAELEKVLTGGGVDYDTVSAKNMPDDLTSLLAYRAVLLDNVYIGKLPAGFLEQLKTYVRDYGCGLIACGGEDSFALGGYRDSVLEEVLPVDMEPRGIDSSPPIAMIMVIDHSGSMSASDNGRITRLDLAVEAASRAVDNFSSKDYVGVVTFDDRPTWQVPVVQVKDKQAIKDSIQSVAEGGGTMIFPALEEATKGILECPAEMKHILLLTDGQGETTNFTAVTNVLKQNNVTLSTVAVGDDADTRLLASLANDCGGRAYLSDAQQDIPRIFAKEVFMSGESYLQNGDFSLKVNTSDELAKGLFEEGWPMISGYVASTPKNGATQVLTSDKDDPILTVWQYGLGRTIAWNTDARGVWSGGFSGQEDYAGLWRRICDYSFGMETVAGDHVEVVKDSISGRNVAVYTAAEYTDGSAVTGLYTDPDGKQGELTFAAKKPGEFEAQLPENEPGIYHISAVRTENGEQTSASRTAAVLQFSDEYRFDV
ncbi:MAG: VWA domain-containing protein, partial [Lachnospiraceae bacterium]|nr:VWA domain-containing protein [Lachnospiraceae bacterium]